jgi:hypothetical protein
MTRSTGPLILTILVILLGCIVPSCLLLISIGNAQTNHIAVPSDSTAPDTYRTGVIIGQALGEWVVILVISTVVILIATFLYYIIKWLFLRRG